MKYRKFGNLDWEASALGFGAMRLPIIDNEQSKIDEPEAIKMMRHAIDNGVNYIDTAYSYHDGQSEIVVGKALLEGYREKVRLATKQPHWAVKTADDFDKLLDEQLEKLQTDYLDFYLLHGIGNKSWTFLRDLDVLDWAEGAISDGRIRHLGFSFHDNLESFKEIVDAYDKWDFCQIQYNLIDVEFQAGAEGLKYAADKGIAVIIMEPLRGGLLARNTADSIVKLWKSSPVQRSQAEWALQWLWSQPEVTLLLSGMSEMAHVVENLAIADRSGVGALTGEELGLMDKVREEYARLCPIPCTRCQYCMPCPEGVGIPWFFQLYNELHMSGNLQQALSFYEKIPETMRPDKCTQCRECEEKCPQDFEIPESLEKVQGWWQAQKKEAG